jgi:hypothetical protein
VRVDPSWSSCVGVCQCGARFLSRDRLGVLVQGARHEQIAHPGVHVWQNSLTRERHADTPRREHAPAQVLETSPRV